MIKRFVNYVVLATILLSVGYTAAAGASYLQERGYPQQRRDDSLNAVNLFDRAVDHFGRGDTESARIMLNEAREIAADNGFIAIEARVFSLLASISNYDGTLPEDELRFLLRARERERERGDSLSLAEIKDRISRYYMTHQAYGIAAAHYEPIYLLHRGTDAGRMAEAARTTAELHSRAGNSEKAVGWYSRADSIYRESGDVRSAAAANSRMAALLSALERYNEALELLKSNIEASAVTDSDTLAMLCNKAGVIFSRIGEYEEATRFYKKALQHASDSPGGGGIMATIYSNMGVNYQNKGMEREMLQAFDAASSHADNISDIGEKARIEMLLATIYNQRGDLHNASEYCRLCIESATQAESYNILAQCYRQYSVVLERGFDYDSALYYQQEYVSLRDSLESALREEERSREQREEWYSRREQEILVEISREEAREQDLRAQRELEESRRIQERREREALEAELRSTEAERERERAEADRTRAEGERAIADRERALAESESYRARAGLTEAELEAAKARVESEEALAVAERERLIAEGEKRARQVTLLIAFLMVLAAAMALYSLIAIRRKNRKLAESKSKIEQINKDLEVKNSEVSRQKEIIELKNMAITDSIMYASRIQKAVLPPIDFLDSWGIDNMILFRPKDIVSGDFYWGFRKERKVYIAAADCTGHGVPGAFMSMLGNAFLNEILITKEFSTASEILDMLRDEIIRALRQRGVTGEARDGIDMSIVVLNDDGGTIEFAGANNPLYLARRGSIERYRGDRMPIGIHVTSMTPFTNHVIEVEDGDVLYLFSDGYADQFGGDMGKKFMYKPFQKLLESVSLKPMDEQLKIVSDRFDTWKGDYEQIDDVLVIGVRVKRGRRS